MRRINILTAPTETDPDDAPGYVGVGMARFGPSLDAKKIAGSVYVLPAGTAVCPYHYEYGNEEWALVLSGSVTLRDPEGEHELSAGDLVVFPEGPEGAHKLTNTSDEPARLLMISGTVEPAVAVYPDSNKIGVWPGLGTQDDLMLRREDGARDYWDREK